jgi:hypothetical protein
MAGTEQWQTTPNAPIYDGRPFLLWNVDAQEFVAYRKRKYGINLNWFGNKDRPKPNFSIERRRASRRPLEYGEDFALREARGGYIRYKKREYGINLGWSKTPVYEWCFTGGRGDIGPVKLEDDPGYIFDTLAGLYNTRAKDDVVYGKRKYGINLVWS